MVSENLKGEEAYTHDLAEIPEDGICVEFGGGIKPQSEPLFPSSSAIREYVCLKNYRLSRGVP